MRLFAATLVAGSTALLDHVVDQDFEKQAHAIAAEKVAAEARAKKIEGAFSEMATKNAASGLAHGLDVAMAKVTDQYKQSRAAAEDRAKTMKTDEALETLKSRMSVQQKQDMSLLMKGKVAVSQAANVKGQFVKAMMALNTMYLGIEDERTNHVMECHNEIYRQFQHIRSVQDQIANVRKSFQLAWKDVKLNWNQMWEQWQRETALHYKRADTERDQRIEMKGLTDTLDELKDDTSLWRFILKRIDANCKKPAKLLLQTQVEDKKALDKQQRCVEHCSNQGKMVLDNALLNVFSDQATLDEVKYDMSDRGHRSLKERLQHLRHDKEEEVHPKYTSFLQVRENPADAKHPLKKEAPYLAIDGPENGCGCGAEGDEASCESMMTVVGQELECEKAEERVQQGIVDKKKAEHEIALKQIEDEKAVAKDNKDRYWKAVLDGLGDMRGFEGVFWNLVWQWWHKEHEVWWYRFKCVTKLQDLDQNQYCAIKSVREYMLDLALEEFGAKDEDAKDEMVQDCDMSDEFTPGDCVKSDGSPHNCFAQGEEKMMHIPEEWGYQDWTREMVSPPGQSQELVDAIAGIKDKDGERMFHANATMALSCPKTKKINSACNVYMCPVDCVVDEWSGWSECSANCAGGKQSRTRNDRIKEAYGGQLCPELSQEQDCNQQSCDQDCILHDAWKHDGHGCTEACLSQRRVAQIQATTREMDAGAEADPCDTGRCQMLRKGVKEKAKGNGKCPDFNHPSRIMSMSCPEAARRCDGDEICADDMDIVIAYECSIHTGRLGCYYIASFVAHILKRMPATTWGYNNMRLGLIKFGNGRSVWDEENKMYTVHGPRKLQRMTKNFKPLIPKIYGDVFKMWSPKPGPKAYKLGFNNMGQTVMSAGKFLEKKRHSRQKILMITHGKRVGCTVAVAEARKLRENRKIAIQMVLFADEYPNSGSEALDKTVSYPPSVNMMYAGPASVLTDWSARGGVAQGFIPSICPGALSVRTTLNHLCDQRVELIHRGRTCANWKLALADHAVSLSECRRLAEEAEYKQFIHTDMGEVEEDGGSVQSTSPNCFTHEKKGKDEAKKNGKPDDSGCDYVPDYGKENEGAYLGWINQGIATGHGDWTNHYAVVTSTADCPAMDAHPSPHNSRGYISTVIQWDYNVDELKKA